MFDLIKRRIRQRVFRFLAGKRQHASRYMQSVKACIYKEDGFGDFILALSAMRLLLDEFGPEQVVLVTGKQGEELARREFPAVQRVSLRAIESATGFQRYRVLRQQQRLLSPFSFEKLVSLRHQRSDYHDLALSWVRTRQSFGVVHRGAFERDPSSSAFLYTLTDPLERASKSVGESANGLCEELQTHRALVSAVLGRKIEAAAILPKLTSIQSKEGSYAVISPLPSRVGPLRILTLDHLVVGVRCLQERSVGAVYLCGSSEQREALQQFANGLARQTLKVEVMTPPSFGEFLNLVAGARIIFTTETATAHLAAALDKASVILIGGGHYGQCGPWWRSSRQIWLTNRLECFGCNWHCPFDEPFCLTRIAAVQIETAIDQVLTRDKGGA